MSTKSEDYEVLEKIGMLSHPANTTPLSSVAFYCYVVATASNITQ